MIAFIHHLNHFVGHAVHSLCSDTPFRDQFLIPSRNFRRQCNPFLSGFFKFNSECLKSPVDQFERFLPGTRIQDEIVKMAGAVDGFMVPGFLGLKDKGVDKQCISAVCILFRTVCIIPVPQCPHGQEHILIIRQPRVVNRRAVLLHNGFLRDCIHPHGIVVILFSQAYGL